MNNYIKIISIIVVFSGFIGCTKKDEDVSQNKSNIQYLADKEKELNDREAKIKLKEIELEEREKKLGVDNSNKNTTTSNPVDTTGMTQQAKDSLKVADKKKKEEEKKEKKKEIQKEITKKFENPTSTVKDYYEYIQRGVNEKGNFDSNMKKAQKYFPSRSADKLKANYKDTKNFSVIEEPKVTSQKDGKATVVSKVQQVTSVNNQDVTKTYTVTYNLTANKNGEWVITGNTVQENK